MDHLSKQQLVLLALLVSFMTSLATGIVTVSLMDQAPQGVTRTVSQVIEKTIEQVSPPQSASVGTVTLSVNDQLASAVASVSPSVVKIEDMRAGVVVGLGLVVSAEGTIMTDKSLISPLSSYEALFSDGTTVTLNAAPVNAASPQADGDVVFLTPASPSTTAFSTITLASSLDLGQTVFSLAGTSTAVLGQGVITDLSASSSPIGTSISADKVVTGSPLFDIRGNIMGIRTSSLPAGSFEPVAPLLSAMPVIR